MRESIPQKTAADTHDITVREFDHRKVREDAHRTPSSVGRGTIPLLLKGNGITGNRKRKRSPKTIGNLGGEKRVLTVRGATNGYRIGSDESGIDCVIMTEDAEAESEVVLNGQPGGPLKRGGNLEGRSAKME